ncbi:metal ABC transporter permease [Pseudodesulfovibrio sp.]|uniref:metal ABC transporter permease n=1 Tax=unclassified Pseudodesulfovibrio TaxID=2661612 RepID=UPI003B00D05B
MDWSVFQYAFMHKALLAGLFGGISCAVVGVLVVTMRISAIGTCVAHAAFAGALLGILLGVGPLVPAFAASFLVAGLVGPVTDHAGIAPDTVVGILFSAMLGLAFLFLGLMEGPRTEALNLFWGSILTVRAFDLKVLAAVTLILLALLTVFYKEIQAVLCHRSVALAVGLPATLIYYVMLFSVGAAVAASLRSIGGLLIYGLIINPAAAAYQLSFNLKRIFALACVFGVSSCWGGLFLATWFDMPAGAMIVLLSTFIFVAATAFSPKSPRSLSFRKRLETAYSGRIDAHDRAGENIR